MEKMVVKRLFKTDGKTYFNSLLFGFLAVQISSWIISSYLPDVPLFKGGRILFLFLIVIAMTSLYILGKNLTFLNLKRDGLFIIFIFVTILVLFLVLPYLVPQIFSSGGLEIRDFLRDGIVTVIQMGPTGIGG